MVDVNEALRKAIEIAIAASELAQHHLRRCNILTVSEKTPGDVVTSADKATEELIRDWINRHYPDHAFLGEECGALPVLPTSQDYTWIVDPIDGTRNFSRAAPFWCVSIALFENTTPLLGVVHDPNLKETFAAASGHGATLNGAPIVAGRCESLDCAVVCFGYTRKRPNRITLDMLNRLIEAGVQLRSQGAGALSICHVAAGRQDAFFEAAINLWDIAAAALILREAGGWADYTPDSADPAGAFPFLAGTGGLEDALRRAGASMMRGNHD